jgi:hypothetical protein
MTKWIVVMAFAFACACTRPNPNLCCIDEADCKAAGLQTVRGCDVGLLCRGNQCIAEPCTTASKCEASAPYCVDELCAESCVDDGHCPGFGQSAERFCIDGTCRACRIGITDCEGRAPICDDGACRACKSHDECASGICMDDGRCANESDVAYVQSAGSATSECTRLSPCDSIGRALTVNPPRKYVLVGSGTYTSAASLAPVAERWIVGAGTAPLLRRSTSGPVITISGGTAIRLQNLEIVGATGTTGGQIELGNGVLCTATSGVPNVELQQVTIRENAVNGFFGVGCTLTAVASRFLDNANFGVYIGDSTATFDRCLISGNHTGLELDGGLYTIINSMIVRNQGEGGRGIDLYSVHSGHRVEFNTIADNVDTSGANYGMGIQCNLSAPASFPNNIIVRNTRQTVGSACTYPSSIILDTDISALKFKSPDVAPYDYHITAGSSAIDAATLSTVDHDFDGQPRVAPRDVGADEYVP